MLSFVIPAHNEQALIGRTLRSIHVAAREVGEPYEIIVANDSSTDATGQIAAEHNARVVSVTHRQIASTRNSGAFAALGERLFFVDADTMITSRVIVAALRAMDHGAAGGGAPARFEGPVPLYARLMLLWLNVFMRVAGLCGGAFLFSTREVFEAVGGFDQQLFGAEDVAFSSALKRKGRFVVLWRHVWTSGRRVRSSSGLQVLGFILAIALFPSRTLKRSSVKKMWYNSERENDDRRSASWLFHASNAAALLIVSVIVASPLLMIPLPESVRDGPLGTLKYGIHVFLCHFGLVTWPCAFFLLRAIVHQQDWRERIKSTALLAICLWVGWTNAREVVLFWANFA